MKKNIVSILCLFSLSLLVAQQKPNILLIIADDLGIDAISGYQNNSIVPVTPTLDSLRENGLMFMNTWATPQCTPTRAAIMSGKYGVKTGVMRPPGNLDLEHTSLFSKLAEVTDDSYATAVIGKWHISNPVDYNHPSLHGVGHYEGLFTAFVDDYYNWEKIVDGQPEQVTEYVTTNLTNAAIDWVEDQEKPWFLWLAHVAPHSPWHVPPTGLFSSNTDDNRGKYMASIEAMDSEISRLLSSLDEDTKQNTVIVFVGDNGTPRPAIQNYPNTHAKSSIYEGGIRVPMFVTGYGVERIGEQEPGLTHLADLHATILEIAGYQVAGGLNNSLSIKPSLTAENSISRKYNYTDYKDGNTEFWAITNGTYKLIEDENGKQEFYDLSVNFLEDNDLINSLSAIQESVKLELEQEAQAIRNGWSCNDGIQNGEEEGIDACNDDCTGDNTTSTTNIGCCDSPDEPSVYYEFTEGDIRSIYTNNFPNHNYCYNPNLVPAPKTYLFNLDKTPELASQTTPLTRANGRPARYYGVAKNGVLMVPVPATPFIFENPNTGQYNWDWVFEPTNNQGEGREFVSLDCSSAHTGPQGYHYHGNMFEYMETILPGITTSNEPLDKPIHIGWASDGFPILYRFGPDENGVLKELLPSFQLKQGLRPGDGIEAPCGAYNGKYINDYEFIDGKGDLDECNGVARDIEIETADGKQTFNYFYTVSSTFPQIPRCIVGTPSLDFENGTPGLVNGVDEDGDGFLSQYDCDDTDPSIHPNAEEVLGNDVDENCDGTITSISDLAINGISIFSPEVGQLSILNAAKLNLRLKIYSEDGRLVSENAVNSKSKTLKNLKPGVYLLNVLLNGNTSLNSKVLVK